MKIKKSIARILFGTDLPQEYLCLAMEEMKQPLKVMLRIKGREFIKDVTQAHLFLGYKPLMIGVSTNEENDPFHQALSSAKKICLEFSFSTKSGTAFGGQDRIVATIHLKPYGQKQLEGTHVFIFEGERGEHKFLSGFHRWMNKTRYNLKAKRKGNVFLPANTYEQVHIAYAVPRKISIITLGDGSKFNMFPTDLHGELMNGHYAISLRQGGKASEQVDELKRIVLSSVKPEYFNETYSLGKNHMQELRATDNFKFQKMLSERFKLPLPEMITEYKELEWKDSLTCGIHIIHFFKIVGRNGFESSTPSLGHIHKFYAQWRKDNKLETNYFIR